MTDKTIKYKNPLRFYVYAYLRSKDSIHGKRGTVYYIGKGQGKRAYSKHHGKTPVPKVKTNIVFLESNLSEVGAFALERRYIEWYGRKCDKSGILLNISIGGDGVSGVIQSEVHIEKRSKAMTGKRHTAERNTQKSISMIGIKHSPERIENNRKSQIGATQSAEHIEKRSKANTGKKRTILSCIHCGKEGGVNVMMRWHFDKCKYLINKVTL